VRGKIEAKLRQMRWSPEQISGWLPLLSGKL